MVQPAWLDTIGVDTVGLMLLLELQHGGCTKSSQLFAQKLVPVLLTVNLLRLSQDREQIKV